MFGRANLALDFGAEAITLLAAESGAAQGWVEIGAATLADEDFGEQIAALKAAAEQRGSVNVDLWLPADQVLNTHLALEAAKPWNRRGAAKAALAERTGLAEGDILVDLAESKEGVWAACAADATIVREAKVYAEKWGFRPVGVTTRYADAAFTAPPDLSGAPNSRAMLMGGGAAAGVALSAMLVAAFVWSGDDEPAGPGPDRISLAPAAALVAPTTPAADDAPGRSTANLDAPSPLQAPAGPAPAFAGLDLGIQVGEQTPFAAAVLLNQPILASVEQYDFSSPGSDSATPILIKAAYTSPEASYTTPSTNEIVVEPLDNEPEVSEPAPLQIVAPELSDGALPGQAPLQGFEVAALGPSPLALRTDEILLEAEAAPNPPEERVEAPLPPQAAEDVPQEIVEEAEDEDAPGPGAVAAAPAPGKRPDSLDMTPGDGAVAAAPAAKSRPKSIKPRPVAVARNTSSAKTVRAPSRGKPTGPGLANAATLKGVLALDQTSLLGVFGTKKNRRALLRLSDGRMRRVSQGEVIDGWVVSRIEAASMRMTRGGEVRNLRLIR